MSAVVLPLRPEFAVEAPEPQTFAAEGLTIEEAIDRARWLPALPGLFEGRKISVSIIVEVTSDESL